MNPSASDRGSLAILFILPYQSLYQPAIHSEDLSELSKCLEGTESLFRGKVVRVNLP